jgi:predicted Rossmann-fold nucleotide-binding protein
MAGPSSYHIKNICVFGGSSPGKEMTFLESANHLGQVLGERKIHLVYGGGSLGLIGGVSIAAFLGDSQVLGVVPKALAKGDIIGKTIGEELQVSTMSD